jgi:hypothetical protein
MRCRATRAASFLGLLAALAAGAGAATASETPSIAIAVNGVVCDLTPGPRLAGGRVLVPIRGVLELAEATVEWDPGDRSITVTRGEHRAVLVMDRRTISADGRPVALDVAPELIDGSVYVPLRAVAETIGATVRWNEKRRMVLLTAPHLPKQLVTVEPAGPLDEQPDTVGPPPEGMPAEPVPPGPAPERPPDDWLQNLMRAGLRLGPAAPGPEAA